MLGVLMTTSAATRFWSIGQEAALGEAAGFIDRAASQRALTERVLRLSFGPDRRTPGPESSGHDAALGPHLTRIDDFATRRTALTGGLTVGVSRQAVDNIEQTAAQFIDAVRAGDRSRVMDTQQAYVSAIDLAVGGVRHDIRTRTGQLQAVSAVAVLLDLCLVVLVGAVVVRALGTASRTIEEELEERRRVRQMMLMVQSIASRAELSKTLGTHLAQLLPGFSGSIHLFDPTRDIAEQVGAWGEVAAGTEDLSVSDCWGLRLGKAYGSNDGSHIGCAHVAPGTRGWCLPLLADGDAIGVLHVRANAGSPMTDALRDQASRLGEGLAVTLANMRLRETLKNQSIRDALTGIFNRRYMEESLKRELKRAGRRRYPLTVMMIDLDHFKRLNDTFGHAVGDEVLSAFAQFLSGRCRADDIVCRYGGEEFVAIFPEMSAADAIVKGAALRQAWAQVTTHGRASTTFSAGFATFPDDASTLEALLGTADAALYTAKSSGRDRMCGPVDGLCFLPFPTSSDGAGGHRNPAAPVPTALGKAS